MLVETPDGGHIPCIGRGKGKRAVVGDGVYLQLDADTDLADALVVGVAERRTALVRADALGRRPQVLAANVDQVFIVCAIEPPLRLGLVDRYLVAAQQQGIQGHVLFNKLDLLGAEGREVIESVLAPYDPIGYQVHYTSAQTGEGVEALQASLDGRCSIFVGHSGVGKTSLLNALDPGLGEKVLALSTSSGRGVHTTATASLYHLPSGGEVIDSPGVRGFAPWDLDPKHLRELFPELHALQLECRFANCQHLQEPGCAVQAALAEGDIAESRYESYTKIRESLTGEAGRFY